MRLAVNGSVLHVECVGSGPPLLVLHGFTGSTRTWDPLLPAWLPHRRVIAVDLLGHGQSEAPADPARYALDRCAADLVGVLDALGVARAAVLGYSLGGRVALHLAALSPARVDTLILESTLPGIADPVEREARRVADATLAERIERGGLASFVAYWEGLPLFASQRRLPAAVRARRRAEGLACSARGLAGSLRGASVGSQASLWERLPHLTMPTLLIVGAWDDKYRAIAREMAAQLPDARLVVVPESGHAVHLEQPAAFADQVLCFLRANDRAAARVLQPPSGRPR